MLAKEVENKFAAVEQATEQLKENRNTESRVNNIVIYQVPDSDSTVFQTRISEDRKFLDEFCNDVFSVSLSDDDIINMHRLGRCSPEASQRSANPRLLLAAFKDNRVKHRIMSNAANLRDANDRYSVIGLSHDLTPKQRAENKQLLDDAKQKLQSENYYYYYY